MSEGRGGFLWAFPGNENLNFNRNQLDNKIKKTIAINLYESGGKTIN